MEGMTDCTASLSRWAMLMAKSIEKAVLPESVVAVMVTCSSSKGYMVNGVMFREGAAGVSPQGRLHNQ